MVIYVLTCIILPTVFLCRSYSLMMTLSTSRPFKFHIAMNSIPCSKVLFKFGIIADVQYVDAPDALNFNQVKLRKYRQSKSIYAQATESWSALCNTTDSSENFDGIRFALVLGNNLLVVCFFLSLSIYINSF